MMVHTCKGCRRCMNARFKLQNVTLHDRHCTQDALECNTGIHYIDYFKRLYEENQ